MMDFPSGVCVALYRRLADAYPHEFRMLYGEDMDRLGEDAIPEVWRRYGVPGVIRLLADIAFRSACHVLDGDPPGRPLRIARTRQVARSYRRGCAFRGNRYRHVLRGP